MTDPLSDILARAKASVDAMTPEERAAMLAAQRESYLRGEMALGSDADEAEARRHALGANNPPEPIVDPREARVAELTAAANEWLATVPAITDEPTAATCEDFLAQLRAEFKVLDERRKAENKPHDDAIKANNALYRSWLDRLETAGKLLKPRKEAYLLLVERRLAEERRKAEAEALAKIEAAESARKAAETKPTVEATIAAEKAVEDAQAALTMHDRVAAFKAQVKGELTGRASGLRVTWYAIVTDWSAAAAHYANHPSVREAIQMAANADARAHKDGLKVPGVEPKMRKGV